MMPLRLMKSFNRYWSMLYSYEWYLVIPFYKIYHYNSLLLLLLRPDLNYDHEYQATRSHASIESMLLFTRWKGLLKHNSRSNGDVLTNIRCLTRMHSDAITSYFAVLTHTFNSTVIQFSMHIVNSKEVNTTNTDCNLYFEIQAWTEIPKSVLLIT